MTQQKAETKHTPGPWTVSWSNQETAFLSAGKATVFILQDMGEIDDRREALGEANARLIAAAPDLLAALVAAYAEIDGLNWTNDRVEGVLAAARAAIAKATNPNP